MRKELIFTVSVLLLVSTGVAVVYENGSSPSNNAGNGSAAITTTQSSASGSVAVGPNGTEYRSNFAKTNASCMSNQSENPRKINFEDRNGMPSVSFEGTVQTANPCVNLRHNVEKAGNNTYLMEITTRQSNGTCVQCIGAVSYEAEFSASEPFSLKIIHGERELETIEHPEFGENQDNSDVDNPEPDQPEGGLLSGFLRWFEALFR